MKSFCIAAAISMGLAASSPAVAALVQWVEGETFHEYILVRGEGLSWDAARVVAQGLGDGWDLATITSAEEQAIIDLHQCDLDDDENCWGEYWLGGYQYPVDTLEANSGWTWVTGEPWTFTNWGNWGDGEPNDRSGPGSEQYLAGNVEDTFTWNDEGNIDNIGGFIAERTCTVPTSLRIGIDIKPGSAGNRVNPGSSGVIPVMLLSQPGLDPQEDVDIGSLTFGRTGDEKSLASCTTGTRDANGDGLADLLCHFYTRWSGLEATNAVATLKGMTKSGIAFSGSDFISTVPR